MVSLVWNRGRLARVAPEAVRLREGENLHLTPGLPFPADGVVDEDAVAPIRGAVLGCGDAVQGLIHLRVDGRLRRSGAVAVDRGGGGHPGSVSCSDVADAVVLAQPDEEVRRETVVERPHVVLQHIGEHTIQVVLEECAEGQVVGRQDAAGTRGLDLLHHLQAERERPELPGIVGAEIERARRPVLLHSRQ